MRSPKHQPGPHRPSLLTVLRDLQLSIQADDPVLCDCDGALPEDECA